MRLGPKGFWKRFGELGNQIGEFAVLVLGGLLMFLKRKFPKISKYLLR
jgi:hypothetical protein